MPIWANSVSNGFNWYNLCQMLRIPTVISDYPRSGKTYDSVKSIPQTELISLLEFITLVILVMIDTYYCWKYLCIDLLQHWSRQFCSLLQLPSAFYSLPKEWNLKLHTYMEYMDCLFCNRTLCEVIQVEFTRQGCRLSLKKNKNWKIFMHKENKRKSFR